jgi:hypothetical protein
MTIRLSLSVPWWRTDLLLHLERLSDEQWLLSASHPDRTDDELYEALSFFDDTGLLDDKPEEHVGLVLFNDAEVEAMRVFGARLDAALGRKDRAPWRSVAAAARGALEVLRGSGEEA